MIVTKIVYRSSITGRFIKRSDAEKYPMTTEKEVVKYLSNGKLDLPFDTR